MPKPPAQSNKGECEGWRYNRDGSLRLGAGESSASKHKAVSLGACRRQESIPAGIGERRRHLARRRGGAHRFPPPWLEFGRICSPAEARAATQGVPETNAISVAMASPAGGRPREKSETDRLAAPLQLDDRCASLEVRSFVGSGLPQHAARPPGVEASAPAPNPRASSLVPIEASRRALMIK